MFSRKLRDNRFVRGIFFMWYRNIGWLKRGKFGHIGNNVILTPPISGHIRNVYIDDNVGIGPYARFSTPHARIIIKSNCAIAEQLTIHTGNHAELLVFLFLI